MKKALIEIIAVFVILSIISFLWMRACAPKPEPPKDVVPKAVLDSVINEANKANELAEYFAKQAERNAEIGDSLRKVGKQVLVRYKTVREKGDTVTIVKTCDSLAVEYAEYIAHNERAWATVDTLLSTMRQEIRSLRSLDTLRQLQISSLQIENQAVKKLAKRRGRALEW